METKMYQINKLFAQENNLPQFFVANQLIETQKAVYLYGHGTLESQRLGFCCKCGLTLKHPVSVKLGIGPICGGHYWNWDAVGGFENAEAVKKELEIKIRDFKVDTWMPKGVIKGVFDCETAVETPKDHKMMKRKDEKRPEQTKQALLMKFQDSGKPAIKIMFPFDMETLGRVKTLPGRRFNGDNRPKYWTCPLALESVKNLQEWGFELDAGLLEYLQKSQTNVKDVKTVDVPGLQMELFPFQKKGVAFIEAKDGRALIGDEMGLGKTAQALAWLQLRKKARPAVVVVPASLKLNWMKEARMWMSDPKIQILSGTNPNVPIIGEIIIVNYDILPNKFETVVDKKTSQMKKKEIPYSGWVDFLIDIKPQVVVMDEAHYIKNNSAKRTKAVRKLARRAPHVIALTGTPIVNRPMELYNAITLIDDTVVPRFWDYAKKYCGAKHNGFGWDFTGATNTQELHEKLVNSIMLRRLKKEVLTELPDKIKSFVPLELTNEKEYRQAERDFISFVALQKGQEAATRASNAQALAEIEGLKQLAVNGKLKQAIEWIKDFIDGNGKLVVMAVHKFVIDALMKEFGDMAVKVDGSVSGPARQDAVDAFQTDNRVRLFIGNIKAAGVGLTLTAASNVTFLELPWTPGDLTQAEDRCHRIGQKNSVTIHYLLANDTIEQKIAGLIDRKRRVLDSVLDGVQTEDESLLTELMREYSE